MKAKEIYKEKYKKNVICKKEDVERNLKISHEIHLLETGKMDDGQEFLTVKIFVK